MYCLYTASLFLYASRLSSPLPWMKDVTFSLSFSISKKTNLLLTIFHQQALYWFYLPLSKVAAKFQFRAVQKHRHRTKRELKQKNLSKMKYDFLKMISCICWLRVAKPRRRTKRKYQLIKWTNCTWWDLIVCRHCHKKRTKHWSTSDKVIVEFKTHQLLKSPSLTKSSWEAS